MKGLNQEQHIQLLQFMSLLQTCKTEEELQELKKQYYNIPCYEFLQEYISEKNENQSFSSYKTNLIYDMDKYHQDYKFVYGENFPAYRKETWQNNKADYTVLNLLNEISECDDVETYQKLIKEKNNFQKAKIVSLSPNSTGIFFYENLGLPGAIIPSESKFNARKQLVEAGFSPFDLPSVEDVKENGIDWLHEEISHFKETLNPNFIEMENQMNQEAEINEKEYEEEFDDFIEQIDANGGMSAMATEPDYNTSKIAGTRNNNFDKEKQDLIDFVENKKYLRESELTQKQEVSFFDKELQEFIDGKLPKNHIFTLGKPSEILVKCGFPVEQRIELSASHLEFKSKLSRHTFDLEEIKGLEEALKNPIAVFSYGNRNKSQNVIVNIEKDGKNFLAGIHFNQNKNELEVSSIRTLYPKDNIEWLNWINQGKMIYGNKEKLQILIEQQQMNFADVNNKNLEHSNQALIAQQRMNVADVNSQVAQRPLYEHCLASSSSILDKFGKVKDVFTDEYPFYEEVKKKAAIEQKFCNFYVTKGNLDARELSVFESEEFYNALISGDTVKIDEYTKTDLHEINELAAEIYEDYTKEAEIGKIQNISDNHHEKYEDISTTSTGSIKLEESIHNETMNIDISVENKEIEQQAEVQNEPQNYDNNNSNVSAPRPRNVQELHQFFINNPYTSGTPVPTLAMRNEQTGHSTFYRRI